MLQKYGTSQMSLEIHIVTNSKKISIKYLKKKKKKHITYNDAKIDKFKHYRGRWGSDLKFLMEIWVLNQIV